MDLERRQRNDIDDVSNNRLTLDMDALTLVNSPYAVVPEKYEANNWVIVDSKYTKYSIVENDVLAFPFEPIVELSQKNITDVTVSFDFIATNILLDNISLSHYDLVEQKICKIPLNGNGHIDVSCNIFGLNNEVLNSIISEQGFNIGLNFKGLKSNTTVKIWNVEVSFKFTNKLYDESDAVVNRLEPYIDFYRDENGDLILQIGGDASGQGRDHSGGDIDTYTKTEIDNKLATKVNTEIGKGLSSNDYTLTEKIKLGTVETNANYYVHPSSHQTGMITESSALTNLETSENATQHEINLAIDSKINSGGGSVDWSDIQNKPSDYPPSSHNHTVNNITDFPNIPSKISDLTNDSDFIEKSNVSGLVKNDGSIDTTTYLSSLPSHNHGYLTNDGKVVQLDNPTNMIGIVGVDNVFKIARYSSIFTSKVKDSNAYSNIGTSANATQETINTSIDTTLGNKPNLSDLGDVALSNDYNDLDNLPTIPTIPTNISAFNNDVGYLTQHQSLANYIQKSNTVGLVKNDGTIDTTNYLSSLPSHNHDDRYYTESEVDTALNSKQNILISGTTIKTINNTSLLGSGNINIQGGGGSITVDSTWITGSTNPAESQLIQSALDDKTDVGHTHNDTEINSSYTNIETSTVILATLNDVLTYNEPLTRINRALEHMIDNWDNYD